MKKTFLIGILLIALGILAFIVPIPRRETHGVTVGDAHLGVETETREKLPSAVGIILLAGGVLALVLGSRRE